MLYLFFCGIDVSYDMSPVNSVLRASSPDNSLSDKLFLMLFNHLRFVLPLVLFLGTSIHQHHSLAHIFFFSSKCMYVHIPLQPTFLHFLWYFSHLRRPSISFINNSVKLGDSFILTSSFPPHPTSSRAFFTAHVPASYISLLVLQPSCIGDYFALDSQTYYSTTQNTQYPLVQFFQSDCIVCAISAFMSPFSVNVAPRYLNNNNTWYLLPAISPISPIVCYNHMETKYRYIVAKHCYILYIYWQNITNHNSSNHTADKETNYGYNSHFPNSLPVDWYPSSHPSSNLHWTSGFFLLISCPLPVFS